jgi:hypothetical protein
MKKYLSFMALAVCIASSPMLSAATPSTPVNVNWTCTTNASSSSLAADKAADLQMKDGAKSAVSAFAFAVANCRDCTKITCESNNP